MINEINWSQFIPDLIVGLLVLLVSSIIAYIKSERFRKWLGQMFNRLGIGLKWLIGKRLFIVLFGFVLILEIVIFCIYSDLKIVILTLIFYAMGLLGKRIFTSRSILASRNKSTKTKTKFLPISLSQGIGNSYLKSRYITPPVGDIFLGNAKFLLEPDSLILDTNEKISHYLRRNDGGKEIELQLPEPKNQIKSVYLLINSSDSKSIYAHRSIGEIRLLFKDAPPIVVELVLGENIREWCPGNPGDFVREASSPMITMGVWAGLSKGGANAVIDCLQIPVYECMRNCYLEKIFLVHKPPQQPPDTKGGHFSIFAISLEIEQHIQN